MGQTALRGLGSKEDRGRQGAMGTRGQGRQVDREQGVNG